MPRFLSPRGRPLSVPIAALVTVLLAGQTSQAGTIVFDFNTLAPGSNNAAVQSYLQGIVTGAHPGGTVTVTGAGAEAGYTSDGHVVGPVSGGSVTPHTLGTTDGGVFHPGLDTFLVNHDSDRITMIFSFPIYQAAFDYQIFPDGSLPDGRGRTPADPNWPDFTFRADNSVVFHSVGVMPGQAGTPPHSPFSGPSQTELAPQLLAVSSTYLFPGGVTRLEFVDWPRMIGIDNLRVDDSAPPVTSGSVVPEPASCLLLGLGGIGLLGLAIRRRRRAAAA